MANFDPSNNLTIVLVGVLVASVSIAKAIAEAVAAIFAPPTQIDSGLLAALKGVSAVRPTNWDDDEDPEHLAAWNAVDAAIAQAEGRA